MQSLVSAQDNYEIQVYASELVPRGVTMVELHSNFTASGRKDVEEGVNPTNHAIHETVEITHGFSEWYETGFYLFTSVRSGEGWDIIGSHIRPRFAVPARYHWPVGLSISNEIGYAKPEFSTSTWSWEIRPIIDQTIGHFYWAVNPALEKAFNRATGESQIHIRAERPGHVRRDEEGEPRPGVLRRVRSARGPAAVE